MDFLNKAFAQLRDLFLSMTPGARITSALLLVAIVVSLGYLFLSQGTGGGTYLMNGEPFPSELLPTMEAAFAKAGLSEYEIDGNRVRVPRGRQADYMGALADESALPPNFGSALDEALSNSNVFESSKDKQERLKIAKQKELSRILGSMDGIESAAVLYDIKEGTGFGKPRIATASVTVKAIGGRQLDEETVEKVRYTVASAVAELKPTDVTVSDRNGRVWFRGSSGGGSALDDEYAVRKRMYERDWKVKIETALSLIPNVVATPNVELERVLSHRTETLKHDPKPIAVQSTEKSVTRSSEGAGPEGRPGYVAQGNTPQALTPARSSASGSREEEEESQSETLNAISGTKEYQEDVGLTPTRVTVTVSIPRSYFERLWRDRNPVAEGDPPKDPAPADIDKIRDEETLKIRDHVATLLPMPEGVADPTALVKVTEFQDVIPPEIPQPGVAENALAWLGESWSTLGIIGLSLFSLMMLRSMLRGAPAPASSKAESGSPSVVSKRIGAEEEAEDEDETERQRRLQRFAGGLSLRDELTELVQEDPEAAANVLRNWIGTPS